MRAVWGSEPPHTRETLPAWAAQAAARRAQADPRVSNADGAVETARTEQEATRRRHQHECMALLVSEYGVEQARRDQFGMRSINPHRNAHDARARAALIRAEADELRRLPVADAALRIEAKRAEQEQTRQRAARRERQFHDPFERNPRRDSPRREGPTRGL